MREAKLKFDDREFFLGSGLVTIGRTPDNSISFAGDSNVSRYHIEIELRGEEYCLIDLNSSNGTTVNGVPIKGEVYLFDGDEILLGGSAKLTLEFIKEKGAETSVSGVPGSENTEATEAEPAETAETAEAVPAGPEGGSSSKGLFLAAGGFLALSLVIGAGATGYYFLRDTSCNARAVIISPEPGDTIAKPTEIEVEIENSECVSRVAFTVDGFEFASVSGSPYRVEINPADFPDLADGFDHPLGIVLEDEKGVKFTTSPPVLLAFETRAVRREGDEVAGTQTTQPDEPQRPGKTSGPSLVEVHDLTRKMLSQFNGGDKYNISNRQLLQEIQRKTADYAQPGYSAKASQFRDEINVAFVREQNLDAPLGFVLAMSRSRFDPARQGTEEGLWRMSPDFVKTNAYDGMCGGQTIADPKQQCAALAAALYMKAMVLGAFEGDVLFAVAAFGKSPQEAGEWKATLPAIRTDVWNSIKTPAEREQLVRFLAAGIVAENPQRFGLASERPLSELYPVAM